MKVSGKPSKSAAAGLPGKLPRATYDTATRRSAVLREIADVLHYRDLLAELIRRNVTARGPSCPSSGEPRG